MQCYITRTKSIVLDMWTHMSLDSWKRWGKAWNCTVFQFEPWNIDILEAVIILDRLYFRWKRHSVYGIGISCWENSVRLLCYKGNIRYWTAFIIGLAWSCFEQGCIIAFAYKYSLSVNAVKFYFTWQNMIIQLIFLKSIKIIK